MKHACEDHGSDEHGVIPNNLPARLRGFALSPLVAGALALLWLAIRSGTKPSRLVYPCQKAAMSAAVLAFGAPFTMAVVAGRRRVLSLLQRPVTIVAGLLVVGVIIGASQIPSFKYALGLGAAPAQKYSGPVLSSPASYRASVYNVTDCEVAPTGDRLIALDNLVATMGRDGLKLYKSATQSLASGPEGIIAPDDVVVIKINYQWDQRGGTNVDLLSGLIRRVLSHPDVFAGEIVVCENAQFVATSNFDRAQNNAQDHARSPHDVVASFQASGFNVSHYDWTLVRGTSVGEYSAGNMSDGYVVLPYDAGVSGRPSYPKFRTSAGTYISLKYGIWDPASGTYDRDHLKFINVPVLKSHSIYAVTASVKHYMGVVTGQLSTNSHNAIATGILGRVIGEIGLADLNIIDALYINAVPAAGPGTSYAAATARRELVASRDPVAADIWSVKNVLIPAFIANGYSPPWASPSADPDDPASTFRQYLDNSMNQILAAGDSVTNDLAKIDAVSGNGHAGDFDLDADVDSVDYSQFVACYTGPGGGPVGPSCAAADFDGDGDVDCDDWLAFQFVWTGPGPIPPFTQCAAGIDPPGGIDSKSWLGEATPNPATQDIAIRFNLAKAGPVRLTVLDVRGRVVRTLVEETQTAGEHSARWDARDGRGELVSDGVFFCRLETPAFSDTKKIVIAN